MAGLSLELPELPLLERDHFRVQLLGRVALQAGQRDVYVALAQSRNIHTKILVSPARSNIGLQTRTIRKLFDTDSDPKFFVCFGHVNNFQRQI